MNRKIVLKLNSHVFKILTGIVKAERSTLEDEISIAITNYVRFWYKNKMNQKRWDAYNQERRDQTLGDL